MRKCLPRVLLLLGLGLSDLHAKSIGEDLQHYFNSLNMGANITEPHAYQGQRAGFYTGGNLYARSSVRNLQVMRINWPKVSAGCGGIDATFGGFSHIKGKEFVDFTKNVLNNSQGLAFQLALEQATPLLGNVATKLQNVATWINQTNQSSCQLAESAVLGLMPRTRQAQQHACQSIGQTKNLFSDWAEARQGCGKGSSNYDYDRVIDENSEHNEVIDNTNVAWNALKKNGLFSKDEELAELMMTLSGTLILTRDKEGMHFQRLPSYVANNNLIGALLRGGEAKVYHCDEHVKCLQPVLTSRTIDFSHGLESRVRDIILDMAAKIKDNVEQTDEAKGLIESTKYPIMKMVSVQMAFMKDSAVIDTTRYSEAIAIDILFQYLNESLQLVKQAAGNLQYPQAIMKEFQSDLTEARKDLSQMESSAHQRMSAAMQMIQETQTIEQMLVGEFSSELTQSLSWANQMR
ncbi:TPA: conjugal transfer protein TraH [Legionella pneumophila]|nr:conjugal transfer protein TraH [Legionella pneumophila]HBD7410339.1 conjugal transfer protein TraH [Legionella pneumophila]HBD9405532.1 conjugal transfer protein TraH [Legionella pneumophila]HBI2968761.1 conjugal transfer protein TraH [Legionella pneumophila]